MDVRVQLSKWNEEKLKPIIKGSNGIANAYILVNSILASWICKGENEARLKEFYAPAKKPISRK